jgi:hypothetical protein
VKTTRELGHLRHYSWMDPRRQQRWLTWPKGGDFMSEYLKNKLASTTFWAAVFGIVAPLILYAAGSLPVTWAAGIGTAAAVAYALSRGLTKWGADVTKGIYSSEFWLGAAQIVILVCLAFPGTIPAKLATLLAAVVAAFYQISRGLAVNEAKGESGDY